MSQQELRGLTFEKLQKWVTEELGEKSYRAQQIYAWLHQKGARDFDAMTDLGKAVRKRLEQIARIDNLKLLKVHEAADGTRKYRFEALKGESIETVFIPRASSDKRHTLCVSSQVGCAMGCTFCLTGRSGLIRNLTAAEILSQVTEARHDVEKDGLRITNIVFMGMGEPLHNIKHVLPALENLCHDRGFGLSTRRITVSTSGLIPQIKKLGKRIPVQLAISLNGPDDALRSAVMPVNERWNLNDLIEACRSYPLGKRRRITFEYVVMADLNDHKEHAEKVAKLLKGMPAKVNLIPFNPYPGSVYKRPTRARVEAFQSVLRNRGIQALIRHTRGDEVLAACGTLSDVDYDPEADQLRAQAREAIQAITD